MDANTYRARTIVRLLEILDEEVSFGDDEYPFSDLHDAIQGLLPKFYPLTEEDIVTDAHRCDA